MLRMISAALYLFAATGGAMAQNLTCTLTAGDAAASQRLCDAVAARLPERTKGHFDLTVTQAHPKHLQARLSLTLAQNRQDGPELAVSVADRDAIPEQALAQFAASLVASLAIAD